MNPKLPTVLETILEANQGPDAIFTALMPALCEVLKCDRCFLYLRNPQDNKGKITHCWRNSSQWHDLSGSNWIEEGDIAGKDPLMAMAFRTPEAVFVEDIETAGPKVVNLTYEREEFGHRALIHAPLYYDELLFGILEPCVFETPRVWTKNDRQVVAGVQEKLGLLAATYVRQVGI